MDAEISVIPLDSRTLLCRAHLLSPSNKKSFSTASFPILACSSLTTRFCWAALLAAWENVGQPDDGLLLPCADLIGMQLKLRCDLQHDFDTTQRLQSHLGLELICNVPALHHFRTFSKVWDTS